MAIVQPLDLYELLVNKLAGSFEIFIFLALFLIAILAGRFKMPAPVFGGMLFVFGAFMLLTNEGQGSAIQGLMLLGITLLGFILARALWNKTN